MLRAAALPVTRIVTATLRAAASRRPAAGVRCATTVAAPAAEGVARPVLIVVEGRCSRRAIPAATRRVTRTVPRTPVTRTARPRRRTVARRAEAAAEMRATCAGDVGPAGVVGPA